MLCFWTHTTSPSEKGKTRVSYFNFEFNSKMATSLVHTLNRPYKGAHKFSATAPDAQGTLVIWARDPQECREHLLNALFDLIFARNRAEADRPQMSLRQGTAPPGGLLVSARIPDGKGHIIPLFTSGVQGCALAVLKDQFAFGQSVGT